MNNLQETILKIRPSCRRKANGWAPALEYENGGVIVSAERCGTMLTAMKEAQAMKTYMYDNPESFVNCHPGKNQLIQLPNTQDQTQTVIQ